MTFAEERALGIRIARKAGLNKTAEVIENNKCYEEIFKTLYNEAGEERSLELIRKAKDPCWAYYFAYGVSGISDATKESLAQVVIEAKDPCWAYYFARNISDISEDTRKKLKAIKAR
ncbi:MAG: hypothetical protein ABIF89_00165 [bacterium]